MKTGTTDVAGWCLVASASRDGRQLTSVVLNSKDRWNDSISLLDYGLEVFKYIKVLEKGQSCKLLQVKDGISDVIIAVASTELGA